jgi:hypothetical protein
MRSKESRLAGVRSKTRNAKLHGGDKPAVRRSNGAVSALPHVAELIDDHGEITVGVHRRVGCVATAHDPYNTLPMLERRNGETLPQLLTRLDRAIAQAWTENAATDEINLPTPSRLR